ncbi:MAG: CocE/NonD family hydrolase, partial [Armatimonadetes bacterium]|nr:CocE/NonD family hydrolase [Armatimonadota bacterium]
ASAIPRREGVDRFSYVPGASPNGGMWDAGVPFCLPGDQRPDEALAVNYTSAPLAEDRILLGRPRLRATVSSDVSVIPLAARLCDVSPDGTSVLVTRGILNLTRRHGTERGEPLPLDTPVEMDLELEAAAWQFRAGHRLRLSVNGSDFPNVWPTPYVGEVRLHTAEPAVLELPWWTASEPLPFQFLPSDSPMAGTGATDDTPAWRVVHDVLEDRLRFVMANGNEFVVSNLRPAEAWTCATSRTAAEWPGLRVRSEASAALTSDRESFHLVLTLNVWVNDVPHAQRRWQQSVRRDWM